MAGYLGAQPVPQATEVRNTYTATASQTSFATSGYTPNFVSVYLNGVHLAPADYTATNGSDVVLASGAAVNDTVEVVAFGTFERDSGTFTGNVTVAGNIDVDGTTNLDVVDIDGAVQLDATLTVGANDQGYDVILYGDTASANVTWDTSADDLIFNGAAGLIVPDGKLTLASTAVTSTAAELNTLDALSRGSILYGNASAATTVLTKGAADTVLTSDGTDISWAAAGGGTAAAVFPSDWASSTNNYTSSGTWSKGDLADADYVWFYLVNSGGGGGNARPGYGGNAMLLYGTAATFNGAAYTIGAAKAGASSTGGTTQNPTTVTLSSGNGSLAFTPTDLVHGSDTSGSSALQTNIRSIHGGVAGTHLVGAPAASYAINTGTLPTNYGLWTVSSGIQTYSGDLDAVFAGGAGYSNFGSSDASAVSLFAGNGGASDGAAGTAPGGGGGETSGGTGASGAAGSLRVYHV
tara:strand:+ start:524 stop:1918 length:1395 start_codon:yes stop_codon:yes gene_type:complete